MSKSVALRIFRVSAACGIAILCGGLFLTRTISPTFDLNRRPDDVISDETGSRTFVDEAVTERRTGNARNVRMRHRNTAASRDRKLSTGRKRFETDVELSLELGIGGRYSIGSGGDPGHLQLPVDEILMRDLIPPDVHFLWCGERWFEFKNYLSVMSVRRTMQPDKIYIHVERHPPYDRVFYNQWLEELKHDYPWLYVRQMDSNLTRYCSSSVDRELRLRIIVETLALDRGGGGGGIYVGASTWLVNFPPSMRAVDLDVALDDDAAEGYVILRSGVVDLSDPDGGVRRALAETAPPRVRRRSACARIHHFYRQPDLVNRTGTCFVVAGDGFDRFFPADIWELDDDFGRLARRLFYGTDAIRRPVPTYDELVPNIAHMIWVGGGRMSYVFYLSVVSLLYVAGVETVFLHGDQPPAGEYWTELMTRPETKDRIRFIARTLPLQVYQGHIPPWWAALQSDLIRVDLMIKYGGIYTDTDAIWVRPLSDDERGYDAVASYDWVDWSWPFPDSVNFGVSYGKRTAPFWRIFRDSMRRLRNDIHGFTGVMMPYKLLEKYPHLLHIDRHLQVICYHSRCHPTYVKDYHNMSKDHVNMNYLTNWREDVHAFHWTFPDPPELQNRSALLQSSGLFADLGRYVLKKAGLL